MRYVLNIEPIEGGYIVLIEIKKKIIEQVIGPNGEGIEGLLSSLNRSLYRRIEKEVIKAIS